MLREEDKIEIKKRLEQLEGPVKLIYFTQNLAGQCQYCKETETLLKEVADLHENIHLEIYNFVTDKQQVEKYQIDKIPATVIEGKEDYHIRFYGIPSGYEFATFLESLLIVASGNSGLPPNLQSEVKKIDKQVHIQVFVTPTCPYCQRAALTGYQLAVENDHIRTDVVEVSEFMHLGQRYGVMGVPKVVINDSHAFEGALPENMFVDEINKALAEET